MLQTQENLVAREEDVRADDEPQQQIRLSLHEAVHKAKSELRNVVKERCLTYGEFTLASGQRSNYYIDGKQIEYSPQGLLLYAQVLWEAIKDVDFNAVSGLSTGSLPLTAIAVVKAFEMGRTQVEGSFVRSSVKQHGTQKELEGVLPKDARVVVLDDVVTTGKSVFQATDVLEKHGAKIVKVVSLIDRQAGAEEAMEGRGFLYEPIFRTQDLLR